MVIYFTIREYSKVASYNVYIPIKVSNLHSLKPIDILFKFLSVIP